MLPTPNDSEGWSQWFAAVRRPAIFDAVRSILLTLQADVDSRQARCELSGRCCRFDSYGHRLYCTGLEIAWLLAQLDDAARLRLAEAELPGMDGCPFQVGGLCSVHLLRPMGCRIYFCDPDAQHWQNDVYEQYLSQLRELHDAHCLPYRYMEWRAGLLEAREILSSREIQGERGR